MNEQDILYSLYKFTIVVSLKCDLCIAVRNVYIFHFIVPVYILRVPLWIEYALRWHVA